MIWNQYIPKASLKKYILTEDGIYFWSFNDMDFDDDDTVDHVKSVMDVVANGNEYYCVDAWNEDEGYGNYDWAEIIATSDNYEMLEKYRRIHKKRLKACEIWGYDILIPRLNNVC